jgi:hypothetical protein
VPIWPERMPVGKTVARQTLARHYRDVCRLQDYVPPLNA